MTGSRVSLAKCLWNLLRGNWLSQYLIWGQTCLNVTEDQSDNVIKKIKCIYMYSSTGSENVFSDAQDFRLSGSQFVTVTQSFGFEKSTVQNTWKDACVPLIFHLQNRCVKTKPKQLNSEMGEAFGLTCPLDDTQMSNSTWESAPHHQLEQGKAELDWVTPSHSWHWLGHKAEQRECWWGLEKLGPLALLVWMPKGPALCQSALFFLKKWNYHLLAAIPFLLNTQKHQVLEGLCVLPCS